MGELTTSTTEDIVAAALREARATSSPISSPKAQDAESPTTSSREARDAVASIEPAKDTRIVVNRTSSSLALPLEHSPPQEIPEDLSLPRKYPQLDPSTRKTYPKTVDANNAAHSMPHYEAISPPLQISSIKAEPENAASVSSANFILDRLTDAMTDFCSNVNDPAIALHYCTLRLYAIEDLHFLAARELDSHQKSIILDGISTEEKIFKQTLQQRTWGREPDSEDFCITANFNYANSIGRPWAHPALRYIERQGGAPILTNATYVPPSPPQFSYYTAPSHTGSIHLPLSEPPLLPSSGAPFITTVANSITYADVRTSLTAMAAAEAASNVTSDKDEGFIDTDSRGHCFTQL